MRDHRPGGSSAVFPEAARQDRRSYYRAVDDLFSGESPTPAATGGVDTCSSDFWRLSSRRACMFWHLTMSGSQPSGTRWGPSQNCCLLSGTLWLLHQGWLRPWKRCLSPKEGDGPSADDLATTAERFVKYFSSQRLRLRGPRLPGTRLEPTSTMPAFWPAGLGTSVSYPLGYPHWTSRWLCPTGWRFSITTTQSHGPRGLGTLPLARR